MVLLSQTPHVVSDHFKAIRDEEEIRRRQATARIAKQRFLESNSIANRFFGKMGGIGLWLVGLIFLIGNGPGVLGNSTTAIALVAQIVGALFFDYWGIRSSLYISKAVRSSAQPQN
jgi:hypothetical protein